MKVRHTRDWKLLARRQGPAPPVPCPEYKYPRSIRGEVEKYDRSRDFHTYSFRVAGTQVFILNPRASSSLPGQCLSYITFFPRGGAGEDASYATLSEYQDPDRTCSRSIGTAGAETAKECVHIYTHIYIYIYTRARKGTTNGRRCSWSCSLM